MYDLAIIGAGAGGIEAAKHALGRKLKTVLIDRDQGHFGGVCLNKGCIPTKFYLRQSGLTSASIREIFKKKNDLVDTIRDGALRSLKKQGLEIIWGEAFLKGGPALTVDGKNISARHILIAAGSLPCAPFKPDNKKIFFAEDIFSLPDLPRRCLIVGGGCIGMEMACLLHNLSLQVTVVEKEDTVLSCFDRRAVRRLSSILERNGIMIRTGTALDEAELASYDLVLLATGRVPATASLGLDEAGIETDDRGRIITDANLRTSAENVYACGDAASAKMYAYIAEYQARLCVDAISGNPALADYKGIPECVYTMPQLAQAGISEEQAASRGMKARCLEAYFLQYPSAHVYDDTQGYMRLVVGGDDALLGITILSRFAAELVSSVSLAIRSGLTLKALKNSVFLHPTLSEIIPALARS